jgi:hypothetical protein
MAGISLLLGDGFVTLPLEQTMIWAVFYATLFWLPVRGVVAVFERHAHDDADYEYELEAGPRRRSTRGRPAYHVGMKILPPF